MNDKKEKRPRSRAWLWLLVILPLLFLAAQFWRSVNRPFRTQTALPTTLTDSVSVNGVVVRSEVPIAQQSDGVVGYVVDDVQRVSAGTEVARIFPSATTAHSFAQAVEMDGRIATLRQAQTDGVNAGTDVNLILRQVNSDLYDYIALLEDGNLTDLPEVRDELSYSLNKLDIAVGKEENYDERIALWEAQRDTWLGTAGEAVAVSAPCTGFFFYGADGYEGLNTETVSALTPTELENLSATWAKDTTAAVGKMVTSYQWRFYCVAEASIARRFERRQAVTLSFTDAGVSGLEGTVESVGEADENGSVVVCIECQLIDQRLSGLRFEAADITFNEYTGIRINKDALHIDSDGNIGVYIKFGTLVRFRRISPIFETSAYILVPLQAGDDYGVNEVSLYDEIIVEGSDLFDGKLL